MQSGRWDGRHLEDTEAWSAIEEQLRTETVAQVAHRHDLPASVIRAAMRRTGLGSRVRVVRPAELAELAPEPTPPAAPEPIRPVVQRPPRPAPAAPARRARKPAPKAPSPPRPVPPPPAPEPRRGWAWKVQFVGDPEPWFAIASDQAAAAADAARTGREVLRIDRYAPAFAC